MSNKHSRRARFALATLGVAGTMTAAALGGQPAVASDTAVPATINQADATHEAAVVAGEDRRLTEIRTISSLARWQNKNWKTPYRLATGSGYTLVLTPSSTPYTVADLLRLAPQTFLRMTDGSYLLTENIAVMARATLQLSQPGGMVLRLASGTDGFATIVSFGGSIDLSGTADAPLQVGSWDLHRNAPDSDLADGRAYIRAIGGQFSAQYVDFSHLGFWSGRTGGVALTGTDRPNTGAVQSIAKAKRAGTSGNITDSVGGDPILPAGSLPAGQSDPSLRYTVPALDYVSSKIEHCHVDSDAFGLFISGANGIQIDSTVVQNSLIAGISLHRFVTNGVITRTTAKHNAGDGFNLDRATTGITMSEATATGNSGNGFTLSGRALADGPSATGSSTVDYGNNSISNSTSTGNGHDGIEVVGGFNIGVQNNQVSDNDMGIVATGNASHIAVTGNNVTHNARHGIALVNGVHQSTVTGNVVDGADSGVYLRDSSAQVKGNTIEHAHTHAVSAVGNVAGTEVSYNVLAGSGASALDTARSNGTVVQAHNESTAWHDTTPWYVQLKRLLHPMTLLWASIFLLVIVSAIRSRKRDDGLVVHPYAHQMAHAMPVEVPQPRVVDLREPSRATMTWD